MNRKKRITNKPAGKCHAQNVINIESGSKPESHFFQMKLMKIKTAGNHVVHDSQKEIQQEITSLKDASDGR